MGTPVRLHRYSFADYLALEEVSTVRHEFLDEEIYAMAGGSVLHAALSAAIVGALHAQLRGRCRVYSSDLRVRVPATGLTTYPDATVVCEPIETDAANVDTVINPEVIVEVLSPSTIDYDLGEKFAHYQQAPSVRAVLYVWQDRRQVEVRERPRGGAWQVRAFGSGETLVVDAVGFRLPVDTLYADAGGP